MSVTTNTIRVTRHVAPAETTNNLSWRFEANLTLGNNDPAIYLVLKALWCSRNLARRTLHFFITIGGDKEDNPFVRLYLAATYLMDEMMVITDPDLFDNRTGKLANVAAIFLQMGLLSHVDIIRIPNVCLSNHTDNRLCYTFNLKTFRVNTPPRLENTTLWSPDTTNAPSPATDDRPAGTRPTREDPTGHQTVSLPVDGDSNKENEGPLPAECCNDSRPEPTPPRLPTPDRSPSPATAPNAPANTPLPDSKFPIPLCRRFPTEWFHVHESDWEDWAAFRRQRLEEKCNWVHNQREQSETRRRNEWLNGSGGTADWTLPEDTPQDETPAATSTTTPRQPRRKAKTLRWAKHLHSLPQKTRQGRCPLCNGGSHSRFSCQRHRCPFCHLLKPKHAPLDCRKHTCDNCQWHSPGHLTADCPYSAATTSSPQNLWDGPEYSW